MRLKISLIGVLAAVIIAAGCGGNGDDSSVGNVSGSSAGTTTESGGDASDGTNASKTTPDAPPLTKAKYIEEGDAICRRIATVILTTFQSEAKKYGGSGKGAEKPPTKKQIELGLVEVVLPELREEIKFLEELGVPRGDEEKISAILRALDRGITITEENPNRALTGPNPLDEASKLSKKYGFKECGS